MVPKCTSGFTIALITLIIATCLWAGTTGKIKGTITDSESGEPLAGANIQVINDAGEIVGGGATSLDGTYFVMNIRPGVYKVKASYQGYQSMTQTSVAVSSDRTTIVDFELKSSVIKADSIIVTAEKPEIEIDITTTTNTMTADEIDNMAVLDVGSALETKVGIVEHQGQLHMRGGRAREVTYVVDGMPVTDPTYGYQGLEVSTRSVQEISVQTGSYNAEYGGALSGIVNIITREGSPKEFNGSLFYLTDDFGFPALNKWSNNSDRIEFTLSGPEPLSTYILPLFRLKMPRGKELSYFLSVTGENTDSRLPYNYLWDMETHMPTSERIGTPYQIDYDWYGFFPERRFNEYTASLKLKQRLSPSMSYTITGTGNWYRARVWDWEYTYTPQTAYISERSAYQLTLNWVHNLSPSTFYEVRAGYFNTSLEYTPGGKNPGEFAMDSTIYRSLDDWLDLNGDGIPQVRVKWWDSNHNGQWDYWEYWEPLVDHVDTIWDEAHQNIDYLDTAFVDERPPMLGEEPWYEVNNNDVFEPRQTNWNDYIPGPALDQPEPFVDGEPFRDGMPFGMGFYGEELQGQSVLLDDTLWVDLNGDGEKNPGEFVWGTYFYNDPSTSPDLYIALEETTYHGNAQFRAGEEVLWGLYSDVTGDGTFTYRNGYCDFHDANQDTLYSIDEEGEPFLDLNGNGYYDGPNGKRDEWEPFIDLNGNGKWDNTDGFLDRGFDRWALWQIRNTDIYMIKADLTSQIDDHNQIKTGAEFQYINMEMKMIQYPEFKYDREPDGNDYEEHGVFRSFYERSPKSFAWYIQDKMEYGGLIANVGVRLDVFLQADEILEDSVEEAIIEVLPDDSMIFKSQTRISPRLGMSYPITDKSKLFFSYAHLCQMPGFDNFYQMPTQASRAGRLIGNPNLDYERTVTYELGVGYAFTDDWTMEFSGYYKDIYGLLNTSTQYLGPLQQSVYENLDYARSRGVELSIRKRYSHRYSLDANYQYAFAYGKSSSDRSGYDALFDQTAIPLQDLPLNWDQRHTFNLVADYRVVEGDNPVLFGLKLPDKWGVNVVFQYGSGFPYTPSELNPNWESEPGEKAWERTNALRMPSNYNIDLKFNKDFSFVGMDYSFVIWIQNLTNQRNVTYVYQETGEPDVAFVDQEVDYDYYKNPGHWSPPRNIRFGLDIKW